LQGESQNGLAGMLQDRQHSVLARRWHRNGRRKRCDPQERDSGLRQQFV